MAHICSSLNCSCDKHVTETTPFNKSSMEPFSSWDRGDAPRPQVRWLKAIFFLLVTLGLVFVVISVAIATVVGKLDPVGLVNGVEQDINSATSTLDTISDDMNDMNDDMDQLLKAMNTMTASMISMNAQLARIAQNTYGMCKAMGGKDCA